MGSITRVGGCSLALLMYVLPSSSPLCPLCSLIIRRQNKAAHGTSIVYNSLEFPEVSLPSSISDLTNSSWMFRFHIRRNSTSITAIWTHRTSPRSSSSASGYRTPRLRIRGSQFLSYFGIPCTDRWSQVITFSTGAFAGTEIPQLYLAFPASAGEPKWVGRGFEEVVLGAGASLGVRFTLGKRDMRCILHFFFGSDSFLGFCANEVWLCFVVYGIRPARRGFVLRERSRSMWASIRDRGRSSYGPAHCLCIYYLSNRTIYWS